MFLLSTVMVQEQEGRGDVLLMAKSERGKSSEAGVTAGIHLAEMWGEGEEGLTQVAGAFTNMLKSA